MLSLPEEVALLEKAFPRICPLTQREIDRPAAEWSKRGVVDVAVEETTHIGVG